MDFVTITDHDTIAGCLEIADREGTFISEELTAWFKGEAQAVHVLCLGIDPDDHEWLQAHAFDLERCVEYLRDREITHALAHPFYDVEAPLTPAQRRILAEWFEVWETRNGSRAPELNQPAQIYAETAGIAGTGGSDDHGGIDVGRTWTEVPKVGDPSEFLYAVRTGRCSPGGDQGSHAKWANSAIALAARSLLADSSDGQQGPEPAVVFRIVQRLMSEGESRRGEESEDLSPADARSLLCAVLSSLGIAPDERVVLEYMQSDDFDHHELARRARVAHEGMLCEQVCSAGELFEGAYSSQELLGALLETGQGIFRAFIPAIPYGPAGAFLAREKQKLAPRSARPRVALVADGIGSMHGVTHTIERLRELGVPGFDVDVVATDPAVDKRLPAACEIEMPLYEGLSIGVPSLPAVVEAIGDGNYDLVHLTSPGPANLTAALVARVSGIPTIGSWHTELASYARLRSGSDDLRDAVGGLLAAFYGQCERVLSPGETSDVSLAELGIDRGKIARWERGVDLRRFDPAKSVSDQYPGEIKVLFAGRLSSEKGIELMAEAFRLAAFRDARLHLLVAGGGPEEDVLRASLGDRATFLGWLSGEDLPRAYASSDIFLFCSETDTFGQVVLEAAASGLPAVAVNRGGPSQLVADHVSGRLCEPDPVEISEAILDLASKPVYRALLADRSLAVARARTWESAMLQLADGYSAALADVEGEAVPASFHAA